MVHEYAKCIVGDKDKVGDKLSCRVDQKYIFDGVSSPVDEAYVILILVNNHEG